jgi:hypothetical protein
LGSECQFARHKEGPKFSGFAAGEPFGFFDADFLGSVNGSGNGSRVVVVSDYTCKELSEDLEIIERWRLR